MFFFYIFSYILTLSGFLLGKSTTEEHDEIKKYVRFTIHSFAIISYLALGYSLIVQDLGPFSYLVFVIALGLFYFSIHDEKTHDIHDVFLIAAMLFFGLEFYYALIPVFLHMLRNSLNKFELKNEIYKLVVLGILYFPLSLIV